VEVASSKEFATSLVTQPMEVDLAEKRRKLRAAILKLAKSIANWALGVHGARVLKNAMVEHQPR
jgi:hypothetical protein